MSKFASVVSNITRDPKVWLITGVAGFIGSNLLEFLLSKNQKVVGLDNFATGRRKNLLDVKEAVGEAFLDNFTFIEGDITDAITCKKACRNVDIVLHQAALGSVPRSIKDPIGSTKANILGFVNILEGARFHNVKSFVYAASSSTYGDSPSLPKKENVIGDPLSPYAVTKYVNELFASVYNKNYEFGCIGLRYFNVFGPRQDPDGAYAAVVPKWINQFVKNETVSIYGDGETSRDFCYVSNVIEANVLAGMSFSSSSDVFNVALGDNTSLNRLAEYIQNSLTERAMTSRSKISFLPERPGDVKHSQADISKIKNGLGYDGSVRVAEGLAKTIDYYLSQGNFS